MDNSNDKKKKVKAAEADTKNTAPVAAAPQVAEVAPESGDIQQAAPKKKLSKGALWGIIGGSIGLVLLVVGVILAVVFLAGPTKEDYSKALSFMEDFKTDSPSYLMNNSSEEEAQKKMNEFTAKIDDYFNKLGAEKAMRDKEVKAAYDAYKSEWGNAKPVLNSLVTVASAYRTIQKECRSSYISYIGKTGEEYGAAYDEKNKNCIKALESLQNSDISSFAEYAKAQINYLKEMRAYGVAMANRSANKDYTSPAPSLPEYPSTSSLSSALMDEQKKVKLDDRESDLMTLLRDKSLR